MTAATAEAVTTSSNATADAIESTEIHWEPRHEAACDLILLMLDRAGGVISSERGHVISEIRRLCNIDDSEAKRATISETLMLMEQAGLVERTLQGKRHFKVTLTCELAPDKIANLMVRENILRKQLNAIKGATDEQQSVIRDCQIGFKAICAATTAAAKNEKGYTALNVTGVLKGCGLTRSNAKRARYYLKMLGLIASHGSCNGGRSEADDDRYLWWWGVAADQSIDVKALMALINSDDKSFEADENRQKELRSRREDGPRERMFAKGIPGMLTDDMCSPVTVTRVETAAVPTPEPSTASRSAKNGAAPRPTPADVRPHIAPKRPTPVDTVGEPNDDLLPKLVAIVQQLELEKVALEERLSQQATAHTDKVAELQTAHAAELKLRDERIAELTARASQRSVAEQAAAEIAARYNQV